MNPHARPYSQAVTSRLRHATPKEKQAVQAELEAHLEDHAAALVEAGYDTGYAHRHAVDAMGDPVEVGEALNRAFPLRWLILSRLTLALLLLLALLLVPVLWSGLSTIPGNLQARWDPLASSLHDDSIPAEDLTPLSISLPFPNGDVIHLYAVALLPQGDTYAARVYGVAYNKNPLRHPQYNASNLQFAVGDAQWLTPGFSHNSQHEGAFYDVREIPDLAKGDPLSVCFSLYGISFSEEIPLPWEEVCAP